MAEIGSFGYFLRFFQKKQFFDQKTFENSLPVSIKPLPLHPQLKIGIYVCRNESESNYSLTITT